jgi:hypothetical protein
MFFQGDTDFLEEVEDSDEITWYESAWCSNCSGQHFVSNVPTENPKGTGIEADPYKA